MYKRSHETPRGNFRPVDLHLRNPCPTRIAALLGSQEVLPLAENVALETPVFQFTGTLGSPRASTMKMSSTERPRAGITGTRH